MLEEGEKDRYPHYGAGELKPSEQSILRARLQHSGFYRHRSLSIVTFATLAKLSLIFDALLARNYVRIYRGTDENE